MSGFTMADRRNEGAGARFFARLATRLLMALAAVWFAMAAPAMAQSPIVESGLEGLGREVSDEELGDMRGKFINADAVHYFGVELTQSWTNADGLTMQATLQFNVEFARGAGNLEDANPSIQISWARVCEECVDPDIDIAVPQNVAPQTAESPAPILAVGKFESVEGLVQTQEIAGSGNEVINSMELSVVPAASIETLAPGEGSSIVSSASQVTEGGGTIQFNVGKNELGITMMRDGESVRQGIDGNLNQVAQHVILQSSLNTIRNEMAITVGINDLAATNQHNVQTALSAMKGRGM